MTDELPPSPRRPKGYRGCLYFLGIVPLYHSFHAHDGVERERLEKQWYWVLRLPLVQIVWRKNY